MQRFQQLSAPIAAKAVEDTAFYRHGKLLSRTDVGFDPECFSITPEAFHTACRDWAHDFPGEMLAGATHDHKRGEDVRARLAVLSSIPHEWRERVRSWDRLAAAEHEDVAPADRYILYQTLFAAWPEELTPDNADGLVAYAERIAAWQEKALREAKLRSSWEEPDEAYEARCRRMVEGLLQPHHALAEDLHAFVGHTAGAATANMLVQTALRCTVPGVSDTFQGTELPDFSLVDPDNRRPVYFALRERLLASGGHPKLKLVAELLGLRREHPVLFREGSYLPAPAEGARAGHVLAFERHADGLVLRCAVALRCAAALLGRSAPRPEPEWWADTQIGFATRHLPASECFAGSPVFIRLAEA